MFFNKIILTITIALIVNIAFSQSEKQFNDLVRYVNYKTVTFLLGDKGEEIFHREPTYYGIRRELAKFYDTKNDTSYYIEHKVVSFIARKINDKSLESEYSFRNGDEELFIQNFEKKVILLSQYCKMVIEEVKNDSLMPSYIDVEKYDTLLNNTIEDFLKNNNIVFNSRIVILEDKIKDLEQTNQLLVDDILDIKKKKREANSLLIIASVFILLILVILAFLVLFPFAKKTFLDLLPHIKNALKTMVYTNNRKIANRKK